MRPYRPLVPYSQYVAAIVNFIWPRSTPRKTEEYAKYFGATGVESLDAETCGYGSRDISKLVLVWRRIALLLDPGLEMVVEHERDLACAALTDMSKFNLVLSSMFLVAPRLAASKQMWPYRIEIEANMPPRMLVIMIRRAEYTQTHPLAIRKVTHSTANASSGLMAYSGISPLPGEQ